MTPTGLEINEGIQYFGLGVHDKEFVLLYYWYLPIIVYLDYNHKQKLFLKNMMYQACELIFGQGYAKSMLTATIQHLQDLKHCCQELHLDYGFNTSDLLLVYLFVKGRFENKGYRKRTGS